MTSLHSEKHTVWLSLGSNLGDRLMYLRGALQAIERTGLMTLEAVSSVYETDPVGFTDQPAFLNIAARITTRLAPQEVLLICQKIENDYQRDRTIHWGPRTLDIDIIEFDRIVLQSDELTIPHPRMAERDFVTIPLKELETGEVGCSENVRPLYTNWYIHAGL
jgi:2-amino-4-hydroxy-6-hydroxymethyldihydropteridine diphosphokinase